MEKKKPTRLEPFCINFAATVAACGAGVSGDGGGGGGGDAV